VIPSGWIEQATLRIAPHSRRALLTNDAELNLYLKLENQQGTGSGAGELAAVLAGKKNPPAVLVTTDGNIQAKVYEETCLRYLGT
jgi:hypothetical protein